MKSFRKRFTEWYIKRGYTFGYAWVYNGKYFTMESRFACPWWVRPLLIFFSPSVYCHQVTYPKFLDGLRVAFTTLDECAHDAT